MISVVMINAEDSSVEDDALRIERIDGRVDTERCDLTREHRRGIKVGERGGRSGVRKVVCRHVDRLNRRDSAGFGRRNTLLELDRKSTRLNSSHVAISYAVFC